MIKKIVLWILVIFWMGLIFYFSSFKGDESTKQSQGFLYNTIGNIIDFFDKDISIKDKEIIIEKYDPIVRKIAHAFIYMVLAFLVSMLLMSYNINLTKCIIMTFIICVMYAVSDEIHQSFINGRSAELRDVLIDSIGIIIENLIFLWRYKYGRKENS